MSDFDVGEGLLGETSGADSTARGDGLGELDGLGEMEALGVLDARADWEGACCV
ncbi:hypothetical protein GCM10027404_17540 [Arthrobacter tumbae]